MFCNGMAFSHSRGRALCQQLCSLVENPLFKSIANKKKLTSKKKTKGRKKKRVKRGRIKKSRSKKSRKVGGKSKKSRIKKKPRKKKQPSGQAIGIPVIQ